MISFTHEKNIYQSFIDGITKASAKTRAENYPDSRVL